MVSGLQVLEGLSHQEGSRRRLRGAQVAKLGPVDKEELSHRHAWDALKRSEGSVCLDRLPFSQAQGEPLRRQGQVGAGLSILRRERGRRCQPQQGCRPGPTRSWLPPSRSTATPNLHPHLSPSYWTPCFHSCSSAAHSPERDFIKQTHLVQKPPASGLPLPTGESPDLFLFFIASFLFPKNRAEIRSFLSLTQLLHFINLCPRQLERAVFNLPPPSF